METAHVTPCSAGRKPAVLPTAASRQRNRGKRGDGWDASQGRWHVQPATFPFTSGKTPHKGILNVTSLIDTKSWSGFEYTGSKINEWEADFTHLLPIYTVYIAITICETQGGVSLFLTVDAGI